jgi:hypothetical protein
MKPAPRFPARIAFRLPQTLHDDLLRWARQDDRPLANLIYTIVRQAVAEHERQQAASSAASEERAR